MSFWRLAFSAPSLAIASLAHRARFADDASRLRGRYRRDRAVQLAESEPVHLTELRVSAAVRLAVAVVASSWRSRAGLRLRAPRIRRRSRSDPSWSRGRWRRTRRCAGPCHRLRRRADLRFRSSGPASRLASPAQLSRSALRTAMSRLCPSSAAGCLDDHRYAASRRMAEQLGERVGADRAGADGGVSIALGPERILGVVGMHQFQPVAPDRADQRTEHRPDPARRGEIVPGGVGMAGVEAHAEPRVRVRAPRTTARGRRRSPRSVARHRRSARSAGPGRCRSTPSSTGSSSALIAAIPAERCAGSTAAPACSTTPRAPSSAPRAIECRTASIDRCRVAAVGDARLTRYGACTNTGSLSSAHRSPKVASAAGVGFGCAQPRGFETNTWIACAPARSAYASPEGLPEDGTWQPIGDGLRGGTALVVHDRRVVPAGRA